MDYAIQGGHDQIFVLLFDRFCEGFYTVKKDGKSREHMNDLANYYSTCIPGNRDDPTADWPSPDLRNYDRKSWSC